MCRSSWQKPQVESNDVLERDHSDRNRVLDRAVAAVAACVNEPSLSGLLGTKQLTPNPAATSPPFLFQAEAHLECYKIKYIYRLDFGKQKLRFLWWKVHLKTPGKVVITGTSQHWTPDLTNLMSRQLLDPPAIFWMNTGQTEVDCNEADAQEFGERLCELAKIRKVMYFVFAFLDGADPSNIQCSVGFKA
ncbi:PREDICTED: olfactory marker protein [Nanorana parkeri]|uniref:olfactory marker protein n=1 Tax=Nanorana parkeri TaxID=125878 RepID=UPI000854D9E0|nr:PREDICTED: olfactory marker protein [Nanorana parkeri]